MSSGGPLRSKALVLYEGARTPHRSCGIALAETFDRPTAAYQSLRRGGITGQGTCGAVVAGQLLLGEFLGDPDPTGPVTPALRAAMQQYQARVAAELARGASPDLVCNNLTAPLGEFTGPARHRFCTALVGQVAGFVADVLRAHGVEPRATPVRLADGTTFDPEAVASEAASEATAPEAASEVTAPASASASPAPEPAPARPAPSDRS